MKKHLNSIFNKIIQKYGKNITKKSRNYIEVPISSLAGPEAKDSLPENVLFAGVIVPLKEPVSGVKVRIDGRTFLNYQQFDSGIAVPDYVAKAAELPAKTYTAEDSMILNIA